MAKSTFDPGGSGASPYFGKGGRAAATAAARASEGRGKSASAGPAEAAKESEKTSGKEPKELATKANPPSKKATEFDTKSKSAVEVGAGEPVGDPTKEQPGTEPKKEAEFDHRASTSGTKPDGKE